MITKPHKDKLTSAIENKKAIDDKELLQEALKAYDYWIRQMEQANGIGIELVRKFVEALNEYKDYLEVELIAKQGSEFLKRQKGQLKLDNSVLEEFLPYLIDDRILNNLPSSFQIEKGSRTSFMSLAFLPKNLEDLGNVPNVQIKEKDQDFAIGKSLYYKFSSMEDFQKEKTYEGKTFLSVLAAECKVNYDKTMFQECAGTAARLKQGCPISKYYVLVEYLDMQPEDTRLTSIDNVFLLRKVKRLPYEKRSIYEEIRRQHQVNPISVDVIMNFINEIQNFIDSTWYNPEEALERGSFV